jgi:hypothetical protein
VSIRGLYDDAPPRRVESCAEIGDARRMSQSSQSLWATPDPRFFRTEEGQIVRPPEGWVHVAPGDALLTRRIKALGPTWTVQQKVGRKVFSRGVWASATQVAAARASADDARDVPERLRRLEAQRARRADHEAEYRVTFEQEVYAWLAFAPAYEDLRRRLAALVTAHATPVGSGTVARTQRIPVDERARAAVVAWLRHQATDYDRRQVERVKGARREVRREVNDEARHLIGLHRQPERHPPTPCALCRAVEGT